METVCSAIAEIEAIVATVIVEIEKLLSTIVREVHRLAILTITWKPLIARIAAIAELRSLRSLRWLRSYGNQASVLINLFDIKGSRTQRKACNVFLK